MKKRKERKRKRKRKKRKEKRERKKRKKKEEKPLRIYWPGETSICSSNTFALFKSWWTIPSSCIDVIPDAISLLQN